jgi:hypothetical protein
MPDLVTSRMVIHDGHRELCQDEIVILERGYHSVFAVYAGH